MGAYNEVRAQLICPSCKANVEVDVQFKYGAVVHDRYQLGGKIRWGANDVGTPGCGAVVADGEGTSCPNCGWDGDWPVYVMIAHDVIEAVLPATGEHDFASAHEAFKVLR